MKNSINDEITKLIRNQMGGVSVIMGSMLLVAIVTTGMSGLIVITSENTRIALDKESETYQQHYELMQEMQTFMETINSTYFNGPYNETLEPGWYWPANQSTDIPVSPEVKVYVDGPSGSIANVWIRVYNIDATYSSAVASSKSQIVEGGTLFTYKYNTANNLNTTYHWSITMLTPGNKSSIELFLEFTTVVS